MDYTTEAVDNFRSFVSGLDTRQEQKSDPESFTLLQDFLITWLEEGAAVEHSGRNFETYLKIGHYIADAVMRCPSVLDYHPDVPEPPDSASEEEYATYLATRTPVPRPIRGIIDDTRANSQAFSRHYYEVVAFRLENRGKRILDWERTTGQPKALVPHPEYPF